VTAGGSLPGLGEAIRDIARERVGRVVDHDGPNIRLSPLTSGRTWVAEPAELRPMSRSELLSALVAELNARSRRTL
jgi:hypothetical protein